jgi:4-hydroxy-tetrahydrodipicolinate reductase
VKIALLGYGKMGKLIEQLALEQGHTIVFRASRKTPDAFISNADVCIDFSHPECALSNLLLAAKARKNVVMGTTGWEDHLAAAQQIISEYNIAMIHSSNFSIGAHLFKLLAEEAAKLMRQHTCYDVSGWEIHHKHKADAPSGTAKTLAKAIQEKMEKHTPITFSSIRCGENPGTHTVVFDSMADEITLCHKARNRQGFAQGALEAAAWLKGKKGYFTLDDMIGR